LILAVVAIHQTSQLEAKENRHENHRNERL
jgi:hypothetical protein